MHGMASSIVFPQRRNPLQDGGISHEASHWNIYLLVGASSILSFQDIIVSQIHPFLSEVT